MTTRKLSVIMTLTHGESGKQDVELTLSDRLVLREGLDPQDVVVLDHWQMLKLLAILKLWEAELP